MRNFKILEEKNLHKACINILNKFLFFWCPVSEKYQTLYLSNVRGVGENLSDYSLNGLQTDF